MLETVGSTSTVVLDNPLDDPDGSGSLEAVPLSGRVQWSLP
ncbi:hypothetical protein [Micromonospora craterilacus]|nr:hypothetical protein [Micromonospora craterilacus]